eukprot:1621445-Rhodomonas_salina.2
MPVPDIAYRARRQLAALACVKARVTTSQNQMLSPSMLYRDCGLWHLISPRRPGSARSWSASGLSSSGEPMMT